MTQLISRQVLTRIYDKGRGSVFSQADFADLAGVTTVNSILRRLTQAGTIRRIIPGLFDYPRYSELLGQTLGPDVLQAAHALARKFCWEIQPDGESALNLMGVSTQVPAQYVFHSDGPTRQYRIGETELKFKHVATRHMKFRHPESAVITHGLKALGPDRIDNSVIAAIRRWLPESKRLAVLRDTKAVTGWIHEAIREVCLETVHG